jgi:hypothetical protein
LKPDCRGIFPSSQEKCFVEVIHTAMHGENIMVKKSKPSVKVESIASVKDEILESVKEETIASGKEKDAEDGKGIDFFYILTGGGVLIGILMVIFIIFRYVLHMI